MTTAMTFDIPMPRADAGSVSVPARQGPLRGLYREAPETATVVDRGATCSRAVPADQPLRSAVTCGTGVPVEIPVGVHWAVGGESDFPVPGEIFAASIAACLDSAIRMIANIMGVRLASLEVAASAEVDVRGTLQMDRETPVGFRRIQVAVRMTAADTVPDAQLDRLLAVAERSCVVLQTLRTPPAVTVSRR